MNVLDAARLAAHDLAGAGAPIALVGGLAVSARAEPRNTRDVDFAVSVMDDTEAESIVRTLASRGYGLVTLLEHQPSGRLATVRLRQGGEPAILVDLLFASSGIEAEITADAERIELTPGLVLPVARAGHLLAMKLLSRDDVRRPQDRVDIASLVTVADEEEIERARRACEAITSRGYARGRELEEELGKAVAAWRSGPS